MQKLFQCAVDIAGDDFGVGDAEVFPYLPGLIGEGRAALEGHHPTLGCGCGEEGGGDAERGAKLKDKGRPEHIDKTEEEMRVAGRHEGGAGDVADTAEGGRTEGGAGAVVGDGEGFRSAEETAALLFDSVPAVVAVVVVDDEAHHIIEIRRMDAVSEGVACRKSVEGAGEDAEKDIHGRDDSG